VTLRPLPDHRRQGLAAARPGRRQGRRGARRPVRGHHQRRQPSLPRTQRSATRGLDHQGLHSQEEATGLAIRSIYHWSPRRIVAHVKLCVLLQIQRAAKLCAHRRASARAVLSVISTSLHSFIKAQGGVLANRRPPPRSRQHSLSSGPFQTGSSTRTRHTYEALSVGWIRSSGWLWRSTSGCILLIWAPPSNARTG
jgi:hypothetical protein